MTEEQKSYYLDPRWQKYRLNRLNKAVWKCEQCGDSKSTLHIHHTFYRAGRKPWQYPFNTTIVLCDACHKGKHDVLAGMRMAEDFNHAYQARKQREANSDSPVEMDEWIFYENGKQVTVQRPKC